MARAPPSRKIWSGKTFPSELRSGVLLVKAQPPIDFTVIERRSLCSTRTLLERKKKQ